MMRAARLLVLSLLLAPSASHAFATFSQWEDGDTNLYIGNLGFWWATNVAEAANEWSRKTAFEFDIKGNGLPACDRFDSNIRLPGNEQTLLNGVEFSDKLCGDADFPLGVLAVVQSLQDETGYLDVVGMIFNEEYTWNRYSGPVWDTEIDFYRVALHELGHFMGLDHEQTNPAIMQPIIGDLDSLTQDDIDGANSLYDAPPAPAPVLAPLTVCRVEQLQAAGKLCKRQLACEAKQAKSLDAGRRDACVAAAAASFAASWDAAVAAGAAEGGCYEPSDAASMAPLVTSAALAAELEIGDGDAADADDRALRAKLLKQAASLCASDLGAWKKEAMRSDPAKLTRSLDKARGRFVSGGGTAIDKARSRGVTYDGANLDRVADALELMANQMGTGTAP
jgi:hypothetical protein